MDSLKEKLLQHYSDYEIHCSIIEDKDFLAGMQEFIREKYIDIISMVTHKQGIISKLLNPSITRKVLFHTNIPFLVFHADK